MTFKYIFYIFNKILKYIFIEFYVIINRFKLYFVTGQILNTRITGPIILNIHPTSILKIGKNVRINSGYFVNEYSGNSKMVIKLLRNSSLLIGNNVGISNSTIIVSENIKIEDNVLIGGGVYICDSDFHDLHNVTTIHKPILIRKNVFIGGNSIILKGSHIGESSIIGAGTIISGIISNHSTIVSSQNRILNSDL